MKEVTISDAALRQAAAAGEGAFVAAITAAIRQAVGDTLTADTMQQLNADQLTLLAWDTLREELMDGGFIELIHNGYGTYIFKNPFAKAVRQLWDMRDLSRMIYDAHTLYEKYHVEIERDCTDEEFMALYEQYPEFDELDDDFVDNEEQFTSHIAHYIDEHLERFATITK